MAFVAKQKIIGVQERFQNHPHKTDILGMIDAARAGAAVAMPYFEYIRQGGTIEQTAKDTTFEHMGFEDVFTEADTKTQAAIIDVLKQVKDIPIEGEEEDEHRCDMDTLEAGTQRWLIDPIDGTFCFKNGLPDFSMTIALQTKQANGEWKTDLGLVADPCQNEIYLADSDKAYVVQGERDKVLQLQNDLPSLDFCSPQEVLRDNPKLDVVVFSRTNKPFDGLRDVMMEKLAKVDAGIRTFSTAVQTARIADGWSDGAVIAGDALIGCDWDTAAALHIAEKAGAKIERFELGGEPVCIVAKNAQVFHALKQTTMEAYKELGLESKTAQR